jgi:hypothetical protein
LVAYTIETDNEVEHRMPHRTATGPAVSGSGPWLVSLPMWANFLRFIPNDGVPLSDIQGLSRIVKLKGLQRWGYIKVAPSASGSSQDQLVTLNAGGRLARATWRHMGD